MAERELRELEQDIAATRRELARTWSLLRKRLPGHRDHTLHLKPRPGLYERIRHGGAAHAGSKPGDAAPARRGSAALAVGAGLGLVFGVPRLLHRG